MPSIVVDAGPLIALFDRDDRHHRRAVEFVRDRRARLVTNLPVLTEAALMLGFSVEARRDLLWWAQDRKSTRLNSSHHRISYAVFCLKKKRHFICVTSIAPSIHLYRTRSSARRPR